LIDADMFAGSTSVLPLEFRLADTLHSVGRSLAGLVAVVVFETVV
jgi:hypothetical protein